MSERKAPDRDKQIRAIVRSAAFLSERLQASRLAHTRACQGEVGEERLAGWRSALGPEGADWLEKRLRWDGFDPALAYLALDDARLQTNLVPDCAIVLRNIAHTARTFDPARLEDLPGDITRAVPFAHLLFPAVLVARGLLCSRLKLRAPLQYPILGMISENAYTSVEWSLLNELSDLSGRTLEYEFRRSQPYGESLLLMFEVGDPAQSGNARYLAFVRGHLQSGLLKLFSSYPVLGRLIATMIVFWSEAIAELFSRLVEDRRALVDHFRLSAATPVQVFDLKLNLSDRHRRGRTVALVKFFGGGKLIYKPKSLSIEAKFNELLRWCNTRDITPQISRTGSCVGRACGRGGVEEYLTAKRMLRILHS